MPRAASGRRVQGRDVNGRVIEFGAELLPLAETMYTDIRPAGPPAPRADGRGALGGMESLECPYCHHPFVHLKLGGDGWNCPNCGAANT
jgi:hypothetical protein